MQKGVIRSLLLPPQQQREQSTLLGILCASREQSDRAVKAREELPMSGEFVYDTYCGLNCGACRTLIANEEKDEQWLADAAEKRGRTLEEMHCHGCKTDVTAVYCRNCGMRICAREKGLEFCSECSDYPCEKIKRFRNDDAPHHSAIMKNLERIGEIGKEEWLVEQKARWSCDQCGTRFSWYSEQCTECGAELHNAIAEEKDIGSE